MHVSLTLVAIVVIFTKHVLTIIFIPVTLSISQETERLYLIIHENNNMIFFAKFFFYFVGQTESFELFKQEAMYITTFDQLGIAKFFPKQEIIDVITKSKETNEL